MSKIKSGIKDKCFSIATYCRSLFESPKTFVIMVCLFILFLLFLQKILTQEITFITELLIFIALLIFTVYILLYVFIHFVIWAKESVSNLLNIGDLTVDLAIIKKLIGYYILLTISVIMIFSVVSFIIVNFSEGNELIWNIDNPNISGNVSDMWLIIYFFVQTFYSTNFGDIVPLGYSRILVCMEMVISAIIHMVILGISIGLVISNLIKNRKK